MFKHAGSDKKIAHLLTFHTAELAQILVLNGTSFQQKKSSRGSIQMSQFSYYLKGKSCSLCCNNYTSIGEKQVMGCLNGKLVKSVWIK